MIRRLKVSANFKDGIAALTRPLMSLMYLVKA